MLKFKRSEQFFPRKSTLWDFARKLVCQRGQMGELIIELLADWEELWDFQMRMGNIPVLLAMMVAQGWVMLALVVALARVGLFLQDSVAWIVKLVKRSR